MSSAFRKLLTVASVASTAALVSACNAPIQAEPKISTVKLEVSGGMQALTSGKLVSREDGCLVLEKANNAGTTAFAWPLGTTVRRASNGQVEVLKDGAVVATTGAEAKFAGGYAASAPDVDHSECLNGVTDTETWIVNLSN